ncbi:LolA family protein [Breznakibacter xylanolyticus]|nr:hypothetical protein [Breznakibacter xylanolyticus]
MLIASMGVSSAQLLNSAVSADVTHQILQKGKVMTVKSQTLYDGKSDKIVCHYFNPKEFYKTVNNKGEMRIYFPKDNTVSYTQNNHYSSNNELMYYFVNNKVDDLGLKSEGFKVKSTNYKDDHLVVTWEAPVHLMPVKEVDVVFENYLPIYSEYRGVDGKVLKKIYYYQYFSCPEFNFPQKITEVSFDASPDSILKRTTYSNIKIGNQVDRTLFNFEIPANAKKVD